MSNCPNFSISLHQKFKARLNSDFTVSNIQVNNFSEFFPRKLWKQKLLENPKVYDFSEFFGFSEIFRKFRMFLLHDESCFIGLVEKFGKNRKIRENRKIRKKPKNWKTEKFGKTENFRKTEILRGKI